MTDERANLPSASGIARIASCRGSFLLEQSVDFETESSDSESGTVIHTHLSGQVTPRPLTPDEMDVADSCKKIEGDVRVQWKHAGEMRTIRESRLWLDDGDGKNVLSGQADVIYIQGSRALILDYKSSFGHVAQAAQNYQLATLAVLVWESYPEVNEITAGIIAPRVTHEVHAVEYNEEDLKIARREIRKLAAEALMPGGALVPGESQCQYCKAKMICPALKKEEKMVLDLPEAKNLSLVPDEEMAIARDVVGRMKKRCAEIEAESLRRAQLNPEKWQGLGWVVTEGSGRKKVTDVGLAAERLVAKGARWWDVAKASTITISAIKELCRAATGLKGKKLTDAVNEVLDGTTDTKQTKPTLKRVGAIEEEENE
jgi:hypothetical protein